MALADNAPTLVFRAEWGSGDPGVAGRPRAPWGTPIWPLAQRRSAAPPPKVVPRTYSPPQTVVVATLFDRLRVEADRRGVSQTALARLVLTEVPE